MSQVFVCLCITALPDWKRPSINIEKAVFFEKKESDEWVIKQYRKFLEDDEEVAEDVYSLLEKSSSDESIELSDEEVLRGVNEWLGSKYVNSYWSNSYMDISPFQCSYTVHTIPLSQ